MEYRATFDNQISPGAKAAAGDLRALQGAALAASDAIKSIPSAAPGVPSAAPGGSGASGGGTSPRSARPPGADAAAKSAKEAAKLQEYLFQVKQRSLALAERAELKATKDTNAANAKAAKTALADWKGLQAEKARAAKAAEPKGSSGAGGSLAGGAKLAIGAAGALASAAAGASVMQLALGYRGMAKLQMITARAAWDGRRLFSGVNPTPALDALARFEKNFSTTTATGRVLQAVLTRTFNSFFVAVAAAEPYATAFLQGAIGAALTLEIAWLKARIALFPLTSALEKLTGDLDGISVAASLGGAAVVLAGSYAASSAASFLAASASATAACPPFLALAAAILAVTAAFDQASKLSKEWDEESSGQIWRKLKSDLGLGGSDKDKERAQGIVSGDDYDNMQARKAHAARSAQAKASGITSGKALADGLVTGMAASEAQVAAAGGKLATAADKGVKAAAKIKSPSRLMRERGGQMGEGAALGIEDKAPRVQAAADSSLVPDGSPAGVSLGGGLGGGIHIAQIGPFTIEGGGGGAKDIEATLRTHLPRIADEIMRRIALELGGGLATS